MKKALLPVCALSLFVVSSFASDMTETEMYTEVYSSSVDVYDIISKPQQEFWNPHCIHFNIRKSIDDHDMRIAAGFRISEVKKTLVKRTTEEKTYYLFRIRLTYTDNRGREIEPAVFACRLAGTEIE